MLKSQKVFDSKRNDAYMHIYSYGYAKNMAADYPSWFCKGGFAGVKEQTLFHARDNGLRLLCSNKVYGIW